LNRVGKLKSKKKSILSSIDPMKFMQITTPISNLEFLSVWGGWGYQNVDQNSSVALITEPLKSEIRI